MNSLKGEQVHGEIFSNGCRGSLDKTSNGSILHHSSASDTSHSCQQNRTKPLNISQVIFPDQWLKCDDSYSTKHTSIYTEYLQKMSYHVRYTVINTKN